MIERPRENRDCVGCHAGLSRLQRALISQRHSKKVRPHGIGHLREHQSIDEFVVLDVAESPAFLEFGTHLRADGGLRACNGGMEANQAEFCEREA